MKVSTNLFPFVYILRTNPLDEPAAPSIGAVLRAKLFGIMSKVTLTRRVRALFTLSHRATHQGSLFSLCPANLFHSCFNYGFFFWLIFVKHLRKLSCLLNDKQNQQISLLLEIYSKDEFNQLNTVLLIDYLNKKEINDEYNLSELGIIDLFILSLIDNPNFYLEYISNLFELELYRKSNDLKLYELNYLYKNRVINNSQYLSLLATLKEKPKELILFEEINREINYNKKLSILEKHIPDMQLDLYDLSRLIYNQFREMRITSRNLDYMNALILLSLYENSPFLENLKVVLNETPEENLDDNYLALGLKRYLTTNELSDLYSDKINDLKSPLMRFFFLSSNLKFANLDESFVEEKKEILVDPIYLFYLSENFNLIQSYIYYIQLSEEYYTLNEFDLYFVNKYLIDNEYLKNEFIKLFFKVHLSNL